MGWHWRFNWHTRGDSMCLQASGLTIMANMVDMVHSPASSLVHLRAYPLGRRAAEE
jgi:hypothetical protein